jgi:G3E family GTPase
LHGYSQIAVADRILLNKTDMVSAATLATVEATVRGINSAAPLLRSTRSECARVLFLICLLFVG